MKYICREKSVDRETVFEFIKPPWEPGCIYLDLLVRRICDGVGIHKTEIRIIDNIIMWHDYHLREDSPCITQRALKVIEKTWKLKAFL